MVIQYLVGEAPLAFFYKLLFAFGVEPTSLINSE